MNDLIGRHLLAAVVALGENERELAGRPTRQLSRPSWRWPTCVPALFRLPLPEETYTVLGPSLTAAYMFGLVDGRAEVVADLRGIAVGIAEDVAVLKT